MMKLPWISFQASSLHGNSVSGGDSEGMVKLASGGCGYGSVFDADAEMQFVDNIDLLEEPAPTAPRNKIRKRWMMAVGVTVLYTALAVAWAWTSSADILSPSSAATKIELLGKSMSDKASKKAEKVKEKEAKKEEKAVKMKEKEAKKKEKEVKKEKKKAEKEKEKEEKKKAPFEPTPYPGCETVNITYIKTPLPFWDHEFAANASGCHLASVHSFEENTKLSKDGLFELALGPEIAMSFMSGKPLSKVFWLGGYHFESDIDESEWTDDSVYDFGPDLMNATEGCLSSSFNFTEVVIKNLTYDNHWSITDCETPLPAIYKCCTKPLDATVAPEAAFPSEPSI